MLIRDGIIIIKKIILRKPRNVNFKVCLPNQLTQPMNPDCLGTHDVIAESHSIITLFGSSMIL